MARKLLQKRTGLYFAQLGILGVVVIILVFVYQFWPWREYQFIDGIWQRFTWLSALSPLARFEVQNRIIGSLFLIPLIYSVISFRWYGTIIIYIISFASIYQLFIWGTIQYLLTNILFLIFPVVFASIVYFEVKLRQSTRQHYFDLERERVTYLTKLTEENEKGRQRIAQELHDDTIQTLLAIASHAEALEEPGGFDTIETKKEIVWIKETIRNTAEDLRRLSLELRPSILDDMGLVSALNWLTEQSNFESKIITEFTSQGPEVELPDNIELNLFRVTQEALQNIKRHSEADKATITLAFEPNSVNLNIEDNGQGFELPKRFHSLAKGGKLGLIGIQQRVQSIGGTFNISSIQGKGTSLDIRVKY